MTTAVPPKARRRIMAGIRASGKLHVGHWLGALKKFVELTRDNDCFYEIADLHALTTNFARSKEIANSVQDIALGFLAAGLDPQRCTIFVQSRVPEISELAVLLSMITPVSWLERVPSYKDQIAALGPEIATHGFLGYPVLQTVDIIAFKGPSSCAARSCAVSTTYMGTCSLNRKPCCRKHRRCRVPTAVR
jgi:tryptophanyl-tRNA synthetase